ncbi:MAG TPA: hypothetical protein VN577_08575 [Terriglobales bacterium]|nr:hypothetical protein [Terriglobales bacterium]
MRILFRLAFWMMVLTLYVEATQTPGSPPAEASQQSPIDGPRALQAGYADCLKADQGAYRLASRLAGPGTRWPFYPQVSVEEAEAMRVALETVSSRHSAFVAALDDNQRKLVKPRLDHVTSIQNQLAQKIDGLGAEIASAKPDWANVHYYLNDLKELLRSSRSEHKRIGALLLRRHDK